MTTVHRYELLVADYQQVLMPQGAILLTVQTKNGRPSVWAQVDTTHPPDPVTLLTVGTGHPVPDTARQYVGTYQLPAHGLVFHVFVE